MKLLEAALLAGAAFFLLGGQRSSKAPSADSQPTNTPQNTVSIPANTTTGSVLITQPINSAQEGVDYINSQILNKTPTTVAMDAATSGGVDSYKQTVTSSKGGSTTVNFTKPSGISVSVNKHGTTTVLQNGATKKTGTAPSKNLGVIKSIGGKKHAYV